MTWIFGYGSIIWRPDFPFVERRQVWVDGHVRRFWQGSPDHRGTPAALGGVVTMVPEEGARCWGMAYRLDPEHEEEVMAALDYRERGGYVRIDVSFRSEEGEEPISGITYIASPENEHFLGPDDLEAMVRQIAGAAGESGRNSDYVINLANHLRDMGLDDPHVFALAEAVKDAVDHVPLSPKAMARLRADQEHEQALERVKSHSELFHGMADTRFIID